MGLFDTLKGSLGASLDGLEASAIPAVLSQVMPGGMQGVLNQLSGSGLGEQVASWLGSGPNQPITVQQLEGALNNEHVQQIAQSLGIPTDKVMAFLSEHLPAAVDQQSPNGVVEEPSSVPLQGDQA